MNINFFISRPHLERAILVGFCLLACSVAGAAGKTNAPVKAGKPANATNAPAATPIEIPKSEFALPTASAQGRDPFFPNSVRTGTAKTRDPGTSAPVSIVIELKGISGKFALINNRTFAAGEEADVTAGKEKVHVRCVSIKEDSVLVEVEGKAQELKLRPGL